MQSIILALIRVKCKKIKYRNITYVYLKMKFLPHLPLPTFEGQMNLMKIMISGAINGEVVVFGNFQLFFYKANTNSFVFIIFF